MFRDDSEGPLVPSQLTPAPQPSQHRAWGNRQFGPFVSGKVELGAEQHDIIGWLPGRELPPNRTPDHSFMEVPNAHQPNATSSKLRQSANLPK